MRGRRRRYRDAEGVDGVGTGERLWSLGERGELPSRVVAKPGHKHLFGTFRESQNALDEKKMQHFCLLW